MFLTKLMISEGVEVDATQLMLALREIPQIGDMAQLMPQMSIIGMQAKELMEPLPDYESAARQNGWKTADMTPGLVVKSLLGDAQALAAPTWQQACELDMLDVPKFPCTAVLVTTPILGAMLELWGERIDRSMFGWWMWADFREQQKRRYLLVSLAEIYVHSEIWRMRISETVGRHDAHALAQL